MTNSLLVEILELTDFTSNCMLVLSNYLPPLSTNSHLRNNSSANNEHLRIAGHCHKQKRIKSYVERTSQQSYSYSLAGAVCTPKQTLLLPLQYKLAMPDDQFIFSSSWLPSPRFELLTLAGYTNCVK